MSALHGFQGSLGTPLARFGSRRAFQKCQIGLGTGHDLFGVWRAAADATEGHAATAAHAFVLAVLGGLMERAHSQFIFVHGFIPVFSSKLLGFDGCRVQILEVRAEAASEEVPLGLDILDVTAVLGDFALEGLHDVAAIDRQLVID